MSPSVAIYRSHFGLVREDTGYGSTSSTLGSRYIPVLSYDPGWEDDLERIVDKGIRGAPSMDFAMYTGVSRTRGGYSHYFYPNEVGVFFGAIFSSGVVSGSSAPYTHTWGSTDVPQSWTLYDFYGLGAGSSERKIVGAQMEKLEWTYSRASGAMTLKPSWVGFPSTDIAETTDSYGTDIPFRGWQAVMSIAGTTNTRILDFTANFSRSVDLIYGGSNLQAPNAREVGPMEVTGTMSVYASTSLEFDRYVANSTGNFILTATDSTNVVTFTATDFRIEKATVDRGGNYSRWNVNWRALHNATDSGPCSVALTVQSSCGF